MGTLTYEQLIVRMDDRTLAHIQVVVVNKLRKGESFLMSWKDAPDVGDGRSAIWIHPYSSIHFKFDGSRPPAINPEWLRTLKESAESSRGLIVTAEDAPPVTVESAAAHSGAANAGPQFSGMPRRTNSTILRPARDPHNVT